MKHKKVLTSGRYRRYCNQSYHGKNPFLNKKGEIAFEQIIFMFVRMIILIILFFSIVYITKKYIYPTNKVEGVEAEIMIRSLMSNRNSVIYYDEAIDRVYPFIIDPRKFPGQSHSTYDPVSGESFNLEKTFDFGEDQKLLAAKLTLFDSDGRLYQYNSHELQPVYINEKYYDTWLAMARTGFFGPGGSTEKTKQYHVNIMDNGKLRPGIIEISVVLPNS